MMTQIKTKGKKEKEHSLNSQSYSQGANLALANPQKYTRVDHATTQWRVQNMAWDFRHFAFWGEIKNE